MSQIVSNNVFFSTHQTTHSDLWSTYRALFGTVPTPSLLPTRFEVPDDDFLVDDELI